MIATGSKRQELLLAGAGRVSLCRRHPGLGGGTFFSERDDFAGYAKANAWPGVGRLEGAVSNRLGGDGAPIFNLLGRADWLIRTSISVQT